jgi:hypothetical protein
MKDEQKKCQMCGKLFTGRRLACSSGCSKQLAVRSHRATNGYVNTFDRTNNPPKPSGHNNIMDTIIRVGHDEDFEPQVDSQYKAMHWKATSAGPGSEAKVEVLRQRVELGLPLWHEEDYRICSRVNSVMREPKGVAMPKCKLYSARRKGLSE